MEGAAQGVQDLRPALAEAMEGEANLLREIRGTLETPGTLGAPLATTHMDIGVEIKR